MKIRLPEKRSQDPVFSFLPFKRSNQILGVMLSLLPFLLLGCLPKEEKKQSAEQAFKKALDAEDGVIDDENDEDWYYSYDLDDYMLSKLDETIELDPDHAEAYVKRYRIKYNNDEFEAALSDLNEIIRLRPNNAQLYCERADLYGTLGESDKLKLEDYLTAARLDPFYSTSLYEASWILATHPDENLRDGALAVKLATLLNQLSEEDDYDYLDNLAAAYAENKQYEKAQSVQKEVIRLARRVDDDSLDQYKYRLDRYNRERPFREQ